MGGYAQDGVEDEGVVDAGPGIWDGVAGGGDELGEEVGCVGEVDGDDDDGDCQEADEAGFGGVAGGHEAGKFAAVAEEAVGEETCIQASATNPKNSGKGGVGRG